MMLKLVVGLIGVAAGAKTFGGQTPSHTPQPALPVVWDNTPDDEPVVKHGLFNLNPYNSVRPEYRDAPPSQADLEKIWQHHLKDHAYKSPFVRPMKSGLWEAGVPNRYAPSGYNRRKFKNEEEALAYVRHKTGAGSNIDYQGALRTEAEIKGKELQREAAVFEKGIHKTVRRHADQSFQQKLEAEASGEVAFLEMEMSDEPELLEMSTETSSEIAFIEMADPIVDTMGSSEIEFLEMSTEASNEIAFIEMAARITNPTKDMDLNEAAASVRDLAKDDLVLDDEEVHERATRDHNLKIAHKMRDFLANYKPDHEVAVVHPGFSA